MRLQITQLSPSQSVHPLGAMVETINVNNPYPDYYSLMESTFEVSNDTGTQVTLNKQTTYVVVGTSNLNPDVVVILKASVVED